MMPEQALTPSVTVNGLTRCFGDAVAVDHLDLELYAGQIFGLLGPNAAGKTTTLRMLAGIIRPDGGSARLFDQDIIRRSDAVKRRIGYVTQHFALYPELTVRENLAFYSSLYGTVSGTRQAALLEQYGLVPFAGRRAGHLSGGYQRRLSIACATSHDPDLVFLDEPTAGIDPVTRKALWDGFYELAAAGKTLFVTTHYMEEAERCHRLAFLDHGRRVAYGTPDEIRALLDGTRIYSFPSRHDAAMDAALRQLEGVRMINRFGLAMRLVVDADMPVEQLATFLEQWPGVSGPPEPAAASLEDVFITLTTGGHA